MFMRKSARLATILALFLVSLLISFQAFSESNSSLEEGANAFQQGQYDLARQKFSELLNQRKWAFSALYNLGNVAARQKHWGEALGFYRRAIKLRPRDRDLLFNIDLAQSQLPAQRGAKLSNIEILRQQALSKTTFNELLTAFLILSAIFLGLILSYLRKRKIYQSEGASAPIPMILAFAAIFFFMVGALATLKLADLYQDRGTIVAAKAELRSGPSETNAALSEISEGTEVEIQDRMNGWNQVTDAVTGLTGWVPDQDLMITSGGGPW